MCVLSPGALFNLTSVHPRDSTSDTEVTTLTTHTDAQLTEASVRDAAGERPNINSKEGRVCDSYWLRDFSDVSA